MTTEQPNTTPTTVTITTPTTTVQPNPTGETPAEGDRAETFEEFHAGLTDAQRALIDARHDADSKGLKATVNATRQERDDLAKQLKSLKAKADKGEEIEADFARLQEQLTNANRRADFVMEAPKHRVANIDAAYKLAVADNLIGNDGVDWKVLAESYPQLFASEPQPQSPNTNAAARGVNKGTTQADIIDRKRRSGAYSGI